MATRRGVLRHLASAAGAALATPLWPAASRAASLPRLSGPLTGGRRGHPFFGYLGDISTVGYVEEEYVLEGQAQRYLANGEWGLDGRWAVQPAGLAPFRTRLLIRRPADPQHFNGAVIVEWLNVSSGFDVPVHDTPGIYEAGFAHVGVSAQYVGLHGSGETPRGLLAWDPVRYAGLRHPGDGYAFDIFSQAGRAVGPSRPRGGVDPMGGLQVRRLIAAGASQSADCLVTYANALQGRDRVYDALILAVCGGYGPQFLPSPQSDAAAATGAPLPADFRQPPIKGRIRADVAAPVLVLNSETEAPPYAAVRQPDSQRFRLWEVAGAAHVQYPTRKPLSEKMARDFGAGAISGGPVQASLPPPTAMSHVMWAFCLDAATRHVGRWAGGGAPPPSQPRIELTGPGDPPTIVRDELGIARGGVRLPDVEAPVARNDGVGNGLFGHYAPFTPAQLRALYPDHASYVAKVGMAAQGAVASGVLLPRDAASYVAAAQTADVPPTA